MAEEFEEYLARRKKTGKLLLVGAALFLIGSIAVPYALMKVSVIKGDTFAIFVCADVLLAAGIVRAAATRLKDSGNWPGPLPFS
jgi:hypothetical protein